MTSMRTIRRVLVVFEQACDAYMDAFKAKAARADARNRAGEFGKWPWQHDYGLWPWQRKRR